MDILVETDYGLAWIPASQYDGAMNLGAESLPLPWLLSGHGLFWLVLAWAVRRAPWWHLRDSESLNILLGMAVAVLTLWLLRAGLTPGLSLHLLGATLLTLMFGWQFAILALTLVLLAVTVNDGHSLAALPVNAVVMVLLPVAVSQGVYRYVDRRLPDNFFVYIFLCAFFGAALALAAVGLASTMLHLAAGSHALEYLVDHYLRYYLLLVFPEAFVTGMCMTLFVVYRPQWVSTFDDARYLRNR